MSINCNCRHPAGGDGGHATAGALADPQEPVFQQNAQGERGPCGRAQGAAGHGRGSAVRSGRGRGTSSAGKLLPRDRVDALLDPASPFLELSPLAAHGLYDGEAPGAGIITGIGRVAGRECVVVANDATVKGGTYYPLTVKKHLRAQEVALREPAAVHLPRRLRRRVPARCRTRCSRTASTSAGSSTTRRTMSAPGIPQIAAVLGSCTAGGAYVPGDERRGGDRPRPGHDLPRRPAAGEGGDRRGRHGRGARRRRPARARLGRRRPPRRRRRARAAHRPRRSSPRSRRGRAPPVGRRAEPSSRRVDPAELYGVVPADPRTPYDVREVIARLVDGSAFHEFKARVRRHAGHRLRPHPRPPGRHRRQQRRPVLRVGAEGRALHRAVRPARHPAGVPAEHHRLHGRPGVRGGRHRQARRQDGHRGRLRPGAEADGRDRRLVRRRQLLDVRPGLLAAVPVDVAERPHLGDGRRAGRDGAGDRAARPARGAARLAEPTRRRSRRRSASSTSARATRTTPPPGCGTTASSTRPTPAPCSGSRLSVARERAARADVGYGVFRM